MYLGQNGQVLNQGAFLHHIHIFFQEEDLRNSSEPKYAHLSDDLHVEITAFAPPSEAHARVAYALAEVRKYLIPDANDEIRWVGGMTGAHYRLRGFGNCYLWRSTHTSMNAVFLSSP